MGGSFSFSVLPDDPLKWEEGQQADQEKTFLGAWSKRDLMRLWERYLLPSLSPPFDRDKFVFEINADDPFVHEVSISHEALADMPPAGRFLVKLFARRKKFDWHELAVLQSTHRCAAFDAWLLPGWDLRAPFEGFSLERELQTTVLEFLFLQNPLGQFTEKRKQLPGQSYPGLGIGREMLSLISEAAVSKSRDFISQTPNYVHNALIYQRAGMRFLSPHCQAWFECLAEDLASELAQDFARVAHAVHEGKLLCGGVVVLWPLWEQALPVSTIAKSFMAAHATHVERIKKEWDEAKKRPVFAIDRAKENE